MILVYDTETTGLTLHPDAPITKQPRMIEFGGILLNRDGSIAEECEIMINPGEPITAEITKITGIINDDLVDAVKFSEALPVLRHLFSQADTVMAHNLPFDKAILKGELARLNVLDFPWPSVQLCTVGLYKDQWGRNPKLTELYESVIGKPLAQTHRALDDVKALVEIIQKDELWLID